MTVNQISIFIENKPEALSELTDILAKNNVNMRALMLADTADFGVARIIADDADNVAEILKKNDFIVNVTGVIAIEIPDEAGSLNRILKMLGENGRNVEYMYGFTGKKTGSAYMIMRTTDVEKAQSVLKSNGIRVLEQKELQEI